MSDLGSATIEGTARVERAIKEVYKFTEALEEFWGIWRIGEYDLLYMHMAFEAILFIFLLHYLLDVVVHPTCGVGDMKGVSLSPNQGYRLSHVVSLPILTLYRNPTLHDRSVDIYIYLLLYHWELSAMLQPPAIFSAESHARSIPLPRPFLFISLRQSAVPAQYM